LRSTQPPFSISESRALVALRAMSSGTMPGSDAASAQCNAPVVDSARRLRAYPGDLGSPFREAQDLNNRYSLSAVFALVYVGIEIYVRDISV
jgi:hypothetical protein